MAAFGNDPDKIGRYQQFWNRESVSRPLTGFSMAGWFPLTDFRACRAWHARYVTPEMIDPGAFLEDHLRILSEGEWTGDDMIRGVCPGQVAIPWLPAMLGCRIHVLPDSLLGEEQTLSWEQARAVYPDCAGAWFQKYAQFLAALVRLSGGAFPVSHTPELGPTDLHAVMRGHTQKSQPLCSGILARFSATSLTRHGNACRCSAGAISTRNTRCGRPGRLCECRKTLLRCTRPLFTAGSCSLSIA